jgi:hypothetical protein
VHAFIVEGLAREQSALEKIRTTKSKNLNFSEFNFEKKKSRPNCSQIIEHFFKSNFDLG